MLGTKPTTVGMPGEPNDPVPPDAGEEAEQANDYVQQLVDAHGGLGVHDPYVNPWADTGGGCPVADDRLCGDPRYERTGQIAAQTWTDPLGVAISDIVWANLRGSWTPEQVALVEAAWNVLARNQDLVEWALCVATGDPGAGECILGYVLGDRPVLLEVRNGVGVISDLLGCGSGHQAWAWTVFTPGEIAFDVVTGGLSWLINDTPSIWLCTGDAGGRKAFGQALELHASDSACSRDCAVLAVAALLLHELTHICFRALWESPNSCAVSYLTGNYFMWGARPRFWNMAVSPCCSSSPVPGRPVYHDNTGAEQFDMLNLEPPTWTTDNMSSDWGLRATTGCDAAPCPVAIAELPSTELFIAGSH